LTAEPAGPPALAVTGRRGGDGRPDPWQPLRANPFRRLWAAQLVSNVGTWMQTVGAQWLVVTLSGSAALVGLVQTASTLPAVLLAVPAGVVSDLVDRRKLLMLVQLGMALVAAGLAALTGVGAATTSLVLAFTFLLACGTALMNPPWQAIQPELIPREQLPQAAALGSLSINLARAVGPALGGLLVAAAGAAPAFALNAASFLAVVGALATWRRQRPPAGGLPHEGLGAALRSGGRYVWHTPAVRRVLALAALFVPAGSALWALLPVLAKRSLHLQAAGYGLLLTSLGVGAVIGAFLLPALRRSVSPKAQIVGAYVVFAAGMGGSAQLSQVPAVLVLLALAGAAWLTVLSTLNATAQLLLPGWVRGRGLSYYLVVLMGGQAVGGAGWGAIASDTSTRFALTVAAVVLLASAAIAAFLPLPDPQFFDPAISGHLGTLEAVAHPRAGPVLVLVDYQVRAGKEEAFVRDMQELAASRRRTGARRWALFRDPYRPTAFTESFLLRSWGEHQLQHSGRQTELDRSAEEAARAHLAAPPVVRHLLSADGVGSRVAGPPGDGPPGEGSVL
jgi:MFS family permease